MPQSVIVFAEKYTKWVVLFLLLYFPIFLNLDVLPIRLWDESQNAVNAYEMLHNGNWLVPTYGFKPDMFSLKPSLPAILEMLCMKVLGPGELAVRLPSAIAALSICLFFMFIAIRLFGSFWLGFIACMVLVTSSGYINEHVARTGDGDSLLVLFTTLYGLSFFIATEKRNEPGPNRYAHLFFVSLILATLTKGVAGLLFLPALFLYTFFSRSFLWWLKNPLTYLYAALLIGVNVFYYWYREAHSPGYWQQVMDIDLFGRFSKSVDGHEGDWWFYLELMKQYLLSSWLYLLPVAAVGGYLLTTGVSRKLVVYASLLVVVHHLIIASAQSKLEWYPAPEYPYIALIIAVFIYHFYQMIEAYATQQKPSLFYRLLPFLFLMLVFQWPYRTIVEKVYDKRETYWDAQQLDMSYYLRGAVKRERDINGYHFTGTDYSRHIDFYLYLLKDEGINVQRRDVEDIKPGDKVIVYQQSIADILWNRYELEQIEQYKTAVRVFVVKGIKSQTSPSS
jgi:4-amino-4-deoxy-L-arabinose transferase-like glycosyltransferase